MKLENRNMSIRKWKRVLKLFDEHKYAKAHELSGSTRRCGHCREYENDCRKCSLRRRARYGYGCHNVICDAHDGIAGMGGAGAKEKTKIRRLILKALELVRTK